MRTGHRALSAFDKLDYSSTWFTSLDHNNLRKNVRLEDQLCTSDTTIVWYIYCFFYAKVNYPLLWTLINKIKIRLTKLTRNLGWVGVLNYLPYIAKEKLNYRKKLKTKQKKTFVTSWVKTYMTWSWTRKRFRMLRDISDLLRERHWRQIHRTYTFF